MNTTSDKVVQVTENDSVSRNEYLIRNVAKIGGKPRTLRLDSPTTIEACRELGILIENLRPKVIDDFKDPSVEEEVVQLRFNHYLQRYNQFVNDVFAKKKELTRTRRDPTLRRNHQDDQHHNSAKSFIGVGSSRLQMRSSPSPFEKRHSHSTSNLMIPGALLSNYTKTMNYLRTSHDTNKIIHPENLLGSEMSYDGIDELGERFDSALAMEVAKFNKIKRQKQKEAYDVFEEEMKRVKMVETLQEKVKRRKEKERKDFHLRKKIEEERKQRAEEKLEQIREAERKYMESKEEEKRKMKKRLEETKKLLAAEEEERKRQMEEQEAKLEQRRKRAEEMRIKLKRDEQTRCDQLKMEIQTKLMNSSEKHHFSLQEKTLKVKSQINRIEESVHKIRESQVKQNEDFVTKLVEKLVKKEENAKSFQQQQLVFNKKKAEEISERNKLLLDHKSDLNKQQKDRMKSINDRFKKVQENLEAKKIQDEKHLRLKQEVTRLRILDKQDNYARKQRQISHERQKVMDRAKSNEAKLTELKNQREILRLAKVEATIQSKIEKERIQKGLQEFSKVTSRKASTEKLTDAQKKILQGILTPEDYEHLMSEERRKEEEKLAALEAIKNGNVPAPVKSV